MQGSQDLSFHGDYVGLFFTIIKPSILIMVLFYPIYSYVNPLPRFPVGKREDNGVKEKKGPASQEAGLGWREVSLSASPS